MNMQEQMLASIRDPGIIQPFQDGLTEVLLRNGLSLHCLAKKTQDAEMSRAALRENAIGEFPEHVLNRSSVLSGGS